MSRARSIVWIASVLAVGCAAKGVVAPALVSVSEPRTLRMRTSFPIEGSGAWLASRSTCFYHQGVAYCVGSRPAMLRGCEFPHCFRVESSSQPRGSEDLFAAVESFAGREQAFWRLDHRIHLDAPLVESAQQDELGRCGCWSGYCSCGRRSPSVAIGAPLSLAQLHWFDGEWCGLREGRVRCVSRLSARDSQQDAERVIEALGDEVASITTSSTRLCALSRSGVMKCLNRAGRDAIASPVRGRAMVISEVELCVLDPDGQLWCQRDDSLRDGWRPRFRVPVAARHVELRRGAVHLCVQYALGEDWQLWCWGDASYGRLGLPQRTWIAAPTERALPEPIAEVFVGRAHACARSVSGHVYCWGANEHGQAAPLAMDVERVPLANRAVSVDSSGPLNGAVATDVRVGEDWSCWTESGRRRCLPERALAAESAADRSAAPSCAAWIERAAQHGFAPQSIACSVGHACFVRDARVYCLGNNESFQVAPGEVSATTPVLTFSLQRDRARAIEL